jgi:hypothetical protein
VLRISATIPDDLVKSADERASQLDRSRSWVLSQALRHYLAGSKEPGVPPRDLSVGGASPTGLGTSRLEQLRADLRLTPEERVKEGERTLRVSDRDARPSRQRVITFDSFEDYLEWDRRESLW